MNADSLDEHRVEFKYQLDPSLAETIRGWARQHLSADEHCDASLGDSYDIHTLYLDTESWDLYHRTNVVGRAKHRVRRYGNDQTLWLETKKKNRESVVTKRRVAMPTDLWLEQLVQPEPSPDFEGQWFLSRVRERALRPAVNVHYRRFARMLGAGRQAMRLTIDSQLEASMPRSDWNIAVAAAAEKRSLGSVQILELKFNGLMPELFKQLLQTFPLRATGFSKFRSAVDAQGLALESKPLLRIDSAHSATEAAPFVSSTLPSQQTLGESA